MVRGRAGTAGRPGTTLLPGVPDLRAFPRKRWADMVRAATTELTWDELGYPDAAGLPRLRRQLAAYLARGRGARVDPGQLIVCAGTLDAVMRLCRGLRAAGHTHVAVKDPGWTQLHLTVAAAGLTPVAIPGDEDGLRVDLLHQATAARAVIVAPAHQFPTGVVLAPARRAELADWAREVDGLVMEDDYDAEFRYDRHPVGALQGVAPDHVALLGSLSKTLSPAVRLGWIAAPERWTAALTARDTGGTPPPVIDQDAFTRFVASGSCDRHLRASRLRYRRRRDHLLRELAARLPGQAVGGAAAGFHLLLPLTHCPAGTVEEAARADVRLASLDDYRLAPAKADASTLVVGYGNLTDQAVPGAVQRLTHAIERVRAGEHGA
ncbi:PLP-dependent aminotransferase family protein [Streptomyces microflavus]